MQKLRLIITTDCNRKCPKCCNKGLDIESIPIENDFGGYKEIILTGGEPLLLPLLKLVSLRDYIRTQTTVPIYVYTAYLTAEHMQEKLDLFDGVTLTLHDQKDAVNFYRFGQDIPFKKTNRLNIFKGIKYGGLFLDDWQVKSDIEWMDSCPLPDGEVLKRHKIRQ
jgi:MoaA/NifB/PqqE/SkfB family radical SAM enzyme